MTPRAPREVLSIHGVPRSGTSWLGQIFNSHPDVAYRYQPLFSYTHKNALDLDSSEEDLARVIEEISETQDDFVLQRGSGTLGEVPEFAEKHPAPGRLVMKMVRFHHLLPGWLAARSVRFRVIALIRHPCAVVNSFLRTPREWRAGWSIAHEWRAAPSKNQGRPEEFYGFERWKEAALLFLRLAHEFPDRVQVVRYESLVADPRATVCQLFAFAGLSPTAQTWDFLDRSQGDDLSHDHGIRKSARVVDRWRDELPGPIAAEIVAELKGTALERFAPDPSTVARCSSVASSRSRDRGDRVA